VKGSEKLIIVGKEFSCLTGNGWRTM